MLEHWRAVDVYLLSCWWWRICSHMFFFEKDTSSTWKSHCATQKEVLQNSKFTTALFRWNRLTVPSACAMWTVAVVYPVETFVSEYCSTVPHGIFASSKHHHKKASGRTAAPIQQQHLGFIQHQDIQSVSISLSFSCLQLLPSASHCYVLHYFDFIQPRARVQSLLFHHLGIILNFLGRRRICVGFYGQTKDFLSKTESPTTDVSEAKQPQKSLGINLKFHTIIPPY